MYGSSRLGMVSPYFQITSDAYLPNDSYNDANDPVSNAGNRTYELTNHLGNVLATINDLPVPVDDYNTAYVLSSQDYYPFGMLEPGRTATNSEIGYRYGFNGKEKDDEVKGEGNQLDFGARIYDSRIGRFLSVDPQLFSYPYLSPYQNSADNPIMFVDENGEGPKPAIDKTLESRLRRISPNFVDVLKRCNNFSLNAMEAFGWRHNSSYFANSKVTGLAGEALVVSYLQDRPLFTGEKKTPNSRGIPAPQYIPISMLSSSIQVGGWDDDKSVDISYKLDLGNKGGIGKLGAYMPFNDINGNPVNPKQGGEKFDKPVNFVIEVKTGTTIQNFVKGFNQALSKSQGIPNAVPVLAMDASAYRTAINESSGFNNIAQSFLNRGGKLMLIGQLNETAENLKNDAKEEVKKGKNPYVLNTGH